MQETVHALLRTFRQIPAEAAVPAASVRPGKPNTWEVEGVRGCAVSGVQQRRHVAVYMNNVCCTWLTAQ
ncbi:hypothetical protein FKM82_027279 [Ascaphus truei]